MSKLSVVTIFLILVSFSWGYSQKYTTATGETTFDSKAPAPASDILGVNHKTQVMIDTETGQVSVKLNMADFELPKSLMQKHYNEKYMETAKYPRGSFDGKIDRMPEWTKDGVYDVSATGLFTIHGVGQKRTLKGKLQVKGGELILTSNFVVKLADHKIDTPVLVFVKITDQVNVKVNWVLKRS